MERRGEDDLIPELIAAAVSTVPVAGPLMAPAAKYLAKESKKKRARDRSKVLQIACQSAGGLSQKELKHRIAANPELVTLVNRVLYAAGMNGQDAALLPLAGFLGTALQDPTRTNDVSAIIEPLTTMSPHHITLLRELTIPQEHGDPGVRRTDDLFWVQSFRPEIAMAAMQTLYAAGFAQVLGRSGGSGAADGLPERPGDLVAITALGRTVLHVLERVAEDVRRSP